MIPHGTPEWYAARLGKATASRMADVCAMTKSGPGASRANYAAELICERMTGQVGDHYQSAEMRRGAEIEPIGIAAYSWEFAEFDIEPGGYLDHPTIGMAGASPDALVGDAGLIEIKCPNTATHIQTLLTGRVPMKYETQITWQMAVTGRAWCDYVSFDPRMPVELRLSCTRIQRNDEAIALLEAEVRAFLAEVDQTQMRLLRRAMREAA